MTQVLAAFIAIPYGLSLLMRGSDGLNRGRYTTRQAGLLAGTGGALILTSLAMLMGARYAGVLVVLVLAIGLVTTLRRRHAEQGQVSPGAVFGAAILPAFLTALILAGL